MTPPLVRICQLVRLKLLSGPGVAVWIVAGGLVVCGLVAVVLVAARPGSAGQRVKLGIVAPR